MTLLLSPVLGLGCGPRVERTRSAPQDPSDRGGAEMAAEAAAATCPPSPEMTALTRRLERGELPSARLTLRCHAAASGVVSAATRVLEDRLRGYGAAVERRSRPRQNPERVGEVEGFVYARVAARGELDLRPLLERGYLSVHEVDEAGLAALQQTLQSQAFPPSLDQWDPAWPSPPMPLMLLLNVGVTAPLVESALPAPGRAWLIAPHAWHGDGRVGAFRVHPAALDSSHVLPCSVRESEEQDDALWVELNEAGSARLLALTTRLVDHTLVVAVDGEVLFHPRVMEPIAGPAIQITGPPPLTPALATLLRYGPLPEGAVCEVYALSQ